MIILWQVVKINGPVREIMPTFSRYHNKNLFLLSSRRDQTLEYLEQRLSLFYLQLNVRYHRKLNFNQFLSNVKTGFFQ